MYIKPQLDERPNNAYLCRPVPTYNTLYQSGCLVIFFYNLRILVLEECKHSLTKKQISNIHLTIQFPQSRILFQKVKDSRLV